jgi:hypothetical protein
MATMMRNVAHDDAQRCGDVEGWVGPAGVAAAGEMVHM